LIFFLLNINSWYCNHYWFLISISSRLYSLLSVTLHFQEAKPENLRTSNSASSYQWGCCQFCQWCCFYFSTDPWQNPSKCYFVHSRIEVLQPLMVMLPHTEANGKNQLESFGFFFIFFTKMVWYFRLIIKIGKF